MLGLLSSAYAVYDSLGDRFGPGLIGRALALESWQTPGQRLVGQYWVVDTYDKIIRIQTSDALVLTTPH